MKKKQLLLALLLTVVAGLFFMPGIASAIGTEAGTVISNYATGTYTDANSNTYAAVQTNTVTTTVSQVGGIDLTPLTAAQTTSPTTAVYYPVTITNDGNGNDTFTVSSNLIMSSGTWTVTLYADPNCNGIRDAGETTVVTSPISLGSDDDYCLIAVVTPDPDALTGDYATLTVTATSNNYPAYTLTGTYTTTISAAAISLSKTTSPTNPKPGDTVTYTITYTNNGTAPAYDVIVTDLIPANTTYVASSLKLNGVSASQYLAGPPAKVEVTIGTVPKKLDPGYTGTVTFQVTINSAVAEFTSITNKATVAYCADDSDPCGAERSADSNNSTLTVAHKPSVDAEPETYSTNQIPGDLNVHPFTVQNTSNGADTYNLTSVGLYWTWTLYHDNNQNGLYDAGDTLVVDTGTDGIIDTGEMLAGEKLYFVAITTVTGYNGQTGQHTVTATSTTDPTVYDSIIKYTPIQTPVITMSKAVSPTGSQPPGTELTYTITVNNTGAAPAKGFFMSDILSTYLDYTEASITVAGSPQSDANDTDFGRFDIGSNTVYVSIPNISAGATLNIVFKATIK